MKLLVFLLVLAFAAPAAAQSGQVSQQEADAFSIRGEGFFAGGSMAATKTFDAVFNSSFAPFVGGGVVIAEHGFFLEIAISHFSKTGQRAFVSDGQAYPLNIPLTVTIVPGFREFLFQPRRINAVGGPSSKSHWTIFPAASFASTATRAWGLVHSSLVTSPVTVMGLFWSYSAANEWCADKLVTGVATTIKPKPAASAHIDLAFISAPPKGSPSMIRRFTAPFHPPP